MTERDEIIELILDALEKSAYLSTYISPFGPENPHDDVVIDGRFDMAKTFDILKARFAEKPRLANELLPEGYRVVKIATPVPAPPFVFEEDES
jgi:hypothetical protein